MSTLISIRESGSIASAGVSGDVGLDSPAKEKEKSSHRFFYYNRQPLLLRRILHIIGFGHVKVKLLLIVLMVCVVVFFASRIDSSIGWKPHYLSSASYPSRMGYTVLINTWKRNSLLKKSVAHYASCSGTDAIHVVWSESDPPSENLKSSLERLVVSKSRKLNTPTFKFDTNTKDSLNSRFNPIKDLTTDAIFSVDDDVIVPCPRLNFAFTVWKSAPFTMVGFVPRMHWLDVQKNGMGYYKYGGWWSVWWMGTYSMVLSKAAFFHRKYLDLYTYTMPSSIHDYVTRERNCEDIAMSMLIANVTGAPPIWVKGKIYEMGGSSSSIKGHSERRSKCLNHFTSIYGNMPLVSTNAKVVNAKHQWFW